MHLTTSAADFSKETLVVKEEETYDAGVFEKVEAEVVKLLKELSSVSFWFSYIVVYESDSYENCIACTRTLIQQLN